MQDLKYLEKLGGTQEGLRAKLTAKKKSDKVKRLIELHSNRLRRAIDTNIAEAPIYGAIDRVVEAPQKNVPYIQARELASSGKSQEEIISRFKEFGLDRMLEPAIDPVTGLDIPDPKNRTVPLLTFNQPLFETVFLPLVAAYCDIRVAKLFSEMDSYPRYKYTPPKITQNDMVVSDIVTDRVQRMTQDIGYAEDDKQSLRQMAYYGIVFNFVKEAYWRESYVTEVNGKLETKTQREGVRFVIPHPRRHFWDRAHPLYTLNTDTGVSYCGYWDVVPWRDIKDNPKYFNQEHITQGGYSLFDTPQWRIFTSFYPCSVTIPPMSYKRPSGVGDYDRIEGETGFPHDELDGGVTQAVMFHKLIPKDWDLFDYDQPVWVRFIYVNLDTPVFAEVLPYTPGYVYLDRYDANKTVASSLALSLAPFQQLLGNFLTQHFQSVKQNMTRIGFVNTDIVPTDQLQFMRKLKDRLYAGIHFLGFSKKKDSFVDADRRDAVVTTNFQAVDTTQTQNNFTLTLMAVERMLGFSPQEVGSQATHEQSAHEVAVANNSTSVSLEFMGSGRNAAITAKKRLLYDAFYCYGDDEVFAELNDLTPERKAALEKLGFSIEDSDPKNPMRFTVRGNKAPLVLDSFMSDREGINRLNDSKLGIAMMQMLGQALSNQALFASIGVRQAVELLNYVWKMVGMPQDFNLKAIEDPLKQPQEQQEQFMQALAQMKDAILNSAVQIVDQKIGEQVVAPLTKELSVLAQSLEQMKARDAEQDAAIGYLLPVVKKLEQIATAPPPPPPPMLPMPPNEAILADPALASAAATGQIL